MFDGVWRRAREIVDLTTAITTTAVLPMSIRLRRFALGLQGSL